LQRISLYTPTRYFGAWLWQEGNSQLSGAAGSPVCADGNGGPTLTGCPKPAGINYYTSTHVLSSADDNKIVVMNCTSYCEIDQPGSQPSATFRTWIESIGSTVATVVHSGGVQWNYNNLDPVLVSFKTYFIQADPTTSNNYMLDAPLIAGKGLSASAASNNVTLSSNAVSWLSFQPGALTSVTNTIGGFAKVGNAATVDNITASAYSFSCTANPTITLYECRTSATCATQTTIGTVTLTAAGTATNGTVSSASITAGDYVAWSVTSGTCTALNFDATAQVHSN
jgi:hypothetical protein